AITVSASGGPGSFSVVFAPNGAVLVSETGSSGPNSSAISSYSIVSDGKLLPISSSVPTLGAANCWNVVTPDGRFVYTSNAGTSSISGFEIGARGALTPLPGTGVGVNASGPGNVDMRGAADGADPSTLHASAGTRR